LTYSFIRSSFSTWVPFVNVFTSEEKMHILIKVPDSNVAMLESVKKWLRKSGIWFKGFDDTAYEVDVTSSTRKQSSKHDLNPGRSWETCGSLVRIWDWDSLGRGPYPNNDIGRKGVIDPAPRGKGWTGEGDAKRRLAGECANPDNLHYISCPKSCEVYVPTNLEAFTFLAEAVAAEHIRRAELLRKKVAELNKNEAAYREAVRIGALPEYKEGKFTLD
jgi:hypothetical protein